MDEKPRRWPKDMAKPTKGELLVILVLSALLLAGIAFWLWYIQAWAGAHRIRDHAFNVAPSPGELLSESPSSHLAAHARLAVPLLQ